MLEPVDRSFVSRELRAHYSDAFYRTRLCDRDAAVYLLFEHKSAPDRFALVQLLVYLGQAYDSLRRAEPPPEYLPLILPVLFTHAPGGWKASVRFQDLLDPVVREVPELARAIPDFVAILDDLYNLDDDGLRARRLGAFGTVAFALLRDARDVPLDALVPRLADELAQLRAASPDALLVLLCYLFAVREDAEEALRAIPSLEPDAMSAAARLIDQGKTEGRKEGRKEGLESVVAVQLEVKFGALEEQHRALLRAASTTRLETIARRLLTADSIEDALAS